MKYSSIYHPGEKYYPPNGEDKLLHKPVNEFLGMRL